MLVDIDDAWHCAIASIERLAQEPFCSSSISLRCEEKVQGIPLLVHGSIQPLPLTFDLHLDCIHSPRTTAWT